MSLNQDVLRNVFRQVPSIVSVLTATDSQNIYSATISSLVSIDIDAKRPVVCFALKKESIIGKILRSGEPFSICVLDAEQGEISRKFAQPREPMSLIMPEFNYKAFGSKLFGIPDSCIFIEATLIRVLDDYESDLYIVSVENSQIDEFKSPLLYQNRKYGNFQYRENV